MSLIFLRFRYIHYVYLHCPLLLAMFRAGQNQNHSTQDSRVVPHRGTNWAALWLTAQIGRDAVLSESYGRGYLRAASPHIYAAHSLKTTRNKWSVTEKKVGKVSASSSDIQRKVTFNKSLIAPTPTFRPAHQSGWWPTLVLCFFGFSKIKGECTAFRTGGVTPLLEDARVETANVNGKAFHHNSGSPSLQVNGF